MKEIRTLKPNEIDARVGTISEKGYSLLLYKDARVDMIVLDETFGPMNWQRKHTRDNANCTIEVWDEDKKSWVGKEDTGTESNTEQEKGLASDSFKRAGVNWGIGRELYSRPFIWIKPVNDEMEQNSNGKWQIKNGYKFKVKDIGYDNNREINRLVIALSKYGKETTLWTYGEVKEQDITMPIQQGQLQFIEELIAEKHYEDKRENILKKYNVKDFSELTYEQGEEIQTLLRKIK